MLDTSITSRIAGAFDTCRIYDGEGRADLDLPDGGTVFLLRAPDGTVIDSPNAETPAMYVAFASPPGAGGGGAMEIARSVTTRRAREELWIAVDPVLWLQRTVCVWVVDCEGDASIFSLEPGD